MGYLPRVAGSRFSRNSVNLRALFSPAISSSLMARTAERCSTSSAIMIGSLNLSAAMIASQGRTATDNSSPLRINRTDAVKAPSSPPSREIEPISVSILFIRRVIRSFRPLRAVLSHRISSAAMERASPALSQMGTVLLPTASLRITTGLLARESMVKPNTVISRYIYTSARLTDFAKKRVPEGPRYHYFRGAAGKGGIAGKIHRTVAASPAEELVSPPVDTFNQHLLHQGQGIPEIRLALSGKSDDHVAGYLNTGACGFQCRDLIQILPAAVAP